MIVGVLGNPKSGKSLVGLAMAALLSVARRKTSKKRNYSDVYLTAVVTERSSGIAAEAWAAPLSATVRRARSLAGVRAALLSAKGAVLLDTPTRIYENALETWRDQSNAARRAAGLAPQARMGPEVWSVINRRYAEAVSQTAEQAGIDLVEVHRQGVGFILHPDYGLVERDGLQARGQAEAGSGADLLLYLSGGLKSRAASTERFLTVVSDASGSATGATFELPDFREAGDVRVGHFALLKILDRELGGAIRAIAPVADAEREKWRAVLEAEGVDDWPEALELSNRSETERYVDTVRLLALQYHLDGQAAQERKGRMESLLAVFGVGSPELLSQVPIERLRAGVPLLEERFKAIRSENAARKTLVLECRAEIARRGLDGRKDTQRAMVARALHEVFGISEREELENLSTAELERGVPLFGDFLEKMGYTADESQG